MSYILDSLKKSDQERQASSASQAALSVLASSEFASASAPINHHKRIVIVFIIVLCMSLLVVFFWVKPYLSAKNPTLISNVSAVQPAKESANVLPQLNTMTKPVDVIVLEEVKSEPNLQAHHQGPQQLYEQIDDVSAGNINALYNEPVQKPVNNDASVIPTIYDLARSQQQVIPQIDYGAHIYATDHKSGFVILNGAKRRAGEKMRNGVYIEQVKAESIVLSYEGMVFSLPAMKSWNP